MRKKPKHGAPVSMGEQSSSFDLYTPIDHKVIDSAAWRDLSNSEVRLLTIIARQWNGNNNGWLHATYSYCRKKGIGSEHTLQKGIASLISHGFICRTRCHGMIDGKNIPSRFAITWRPLCAKKDRGGLFVDGFVLNAFEKWEPEKKSDPQKVQGSASNKCRFRGEKLQKVQGLRPAVNADYEIFAIKGGISAGVGSHVKGTQEHVNQQRESVVADLQASGRSSLRGVVLNYRQTEARPFDYKPPRNRKATPCGPLAA